MAVPVSYYFSNFAVFIYILNDVFIHSFQNCRNNPIDKFHIRAIPFKSTWEGECHFFIFLLVVGVKPYLFMLGGGSLENEFCWGGSND
jgi:hypothetical protein